MENNQPNHPRPPRPGSGRFVTGGGLVPATAGEEAIAGKVYGVLTRDRIGAGVRYRS